MNLQEYRNTPTEQQRTAELLRLLPDKGGSALDIGARDGFYSHLLAERFDEVVALDLAVPKVVHPKVRNVKGNAACLEFPDRSFDLVFCAEVLEHLPEPTLSAACREIERVARGVILIGVPYKQDLRLGRTTC
ncbi:MAG: class I SAM-dependent methyltransferase, partial [Kiritimatiellia bacterium]|nr:class I SAM-dependent methyltransferase [Kiritimatiellia bacterium]